MKHNGFVDLHTHGFGGHDTRTAHPEEILKIAGFHGKAGTRAILPTIYSGSITEMRLNMEAVRKAMEIQQASPPHSPLALSKGGRVRAPHASLILGVHLEGPFLNPRWCGALDRDSFIKPTHSSFKQLIDGYEDIIRIMTIAPEMPGALKIIERCAGSGIRINMGHSDATFEEAESGKKAGATGIAHIFNAMRPFHHREPGLSGFGLIDDTLYIEVISDGVHLHPETLKFIFRSKRHDRIILISDSVKGVGRGGEPLYTRKGILGGSSIALADSIGVLKKVGVSEEAIREAGIYNPERYLSAG